MRRSKQSRVKLRSRGGAKDGTAAALCVKPEVYVRGTAWWGRFTAGKELYRVPLKLRVDGQVPATIKEEGDVRFEMSRARARERLEVVRNFYVQEIAEGRAPSWRTRIQVPDAPPHEPLRVDQLAATWRKIYDADLPSATDSRKRLVRRAKSVSYKNQIEAMLARLAEFIRRKFNGIKLADQITRKHVDAFLLREYTENLGVAASYNKLLVGIRGALKYLVTEKRMRSNPSDGLPLLDQERKGEVVSREAFMPDEVQELLDEAKKTNPLLHALITTVVNTGLKKVDACRLEWSAIDLDARVLTLTPSKRAAAVEVPIFPPLLKLLHQVAGGKKRRVGMVFPELERGYRNNRSYLTREFYELCKRCGWKEKELVEKREGRRAASIRGIHSLRTSFITWALDAGIPPATVQLLTGHKSTLVIEGHYNRPPVEMLRAKMVVVSPSVITGAVPSRPSRPVASRGPKGAKSGDKREDAEGELRHCLNFLFPDAESSDGNLALLRAALTRAGDELPAGHPLRAPVVGALPILRQDTFAAVLARLHGKVVGAARPGNQMLF